MDSKNDQNPVSTEKLLFKQSPPPVALYDADPKWATRQEQVRQAFKHAWKGYATDAFGMDEYQPLSHKGHDWSPGGIGLMIIDSLDTIMLMNLEEEYTQARDWIENRLSFDKNQDVNLFETTIRVLGGLLSAYHLSDNDQLYLDKATDLGNRLLGAFDSDSGIPYAGVVLSTGMAHKVQYIQSSTAEVTTIQMEFKYLSHLTGDKKYWDKVETVMERIRQMIDDNRTLDGLVPIMIDPNTGGFSGSEIRLGSRGDSYYEYLLKQYLQTDKTEEVYRKMYDQTVNAMKKYLVRRSQPSEFLFLGELPQGKNSPDHISPKMDHLVCFMGGSFALGATEGPSLKVSKRPMSSQDLEDIRLGEELTRTCYEMYNSTATGLASEIVYFNMQSENLQDASLQDIIIKPRDTHCLLRPETVESLFLLWRITGDEMYREWGWKIFEAFEKHTKLPNGGYAALKDVTVVPPPQDDRMDTFFLAETLKYLYLLFGPTDLIPLDKYVFNTEAHPLPVFKPRW
ncbi:glycoside hydrolase [Umbelopsis sp. AD052]|nr:glycoside hydrolase [Umbelopsis sp. AD052]